MSNILNDIVNNKISIEEGLQRLLVIANKTNNTELSKWCSNELNGYDNFSDLPNYRIVCNRNVVYSGINGSLQVTNTPIGLGYLTEDVISKIAEVGLFENIRQIENYNDLKKSMYKDLTFLAGEIYKNTNNGFGGVQCTSVSQVIPYSVYSSIYSNVKTRVINLICAYETAKINLDGLDIKKDEIKALKEQNNEIFKTVISEGVIYTFPPKQKKIMWNIIIPILTAIIGSVISGIVTYLITNALFK